MQQSPVLSCYLVLSRPVFNPRPSLAHTPSLSLSPRPLPFPCMHACIPSHLRPPPTANCPSVHARTHTARTHTTHTHICTRTTTPSPSRTTSTYPTLTPHLRH
ncbi:uncharacterized protein K452DRAFT_158894 [Aplosporella prunicola CBS 121167]|uniref:Uncharacterized protein n=1 Tax=Aplosporella prunicola CBS 121167 TaxID=1176127 RepID=A0A6A6AWZ8_9PEZI|nr:uncharacterized protein K452DRAFT_158894 [Aplosporella prunicola CBS 121167]KAF2135788.1 hypothetical protein K452DRAFT_158894 [Aplosporella prunicola CBS 121167]